MCVTNKAVIMSKPRIPSNIDSELVNGIKLEFGKFNLRMSIVLIRTFIVIGAILFPFDFYNQGGLIFSMPGIIAWLTHTLLSTALIAGMIRGLFKYEVNEFGLKCHNYKGGTWFIAWDQFEEVKKKRFLGMEYTSIQPKDNYDTFSISNSIENYELFKALCYKINKGQHKLIEYL